MLEFFEKRLISQEISGRAVDLEEIPKRRRRYAPSEITITFLQDVEPKVEEHSLGDLGEPANYKAAMLDPESNKWIDAMNVEIQSMMDNMGMGSRGRVFHSLFTFLYVNVKVLLIPNHQESGIKDLMRNSKGFDFLKNLDEPCVYNKS
ncbi:hypothetical protein Tco_0005944 [Tanacetum coccineum]